MSQTAQQHTLQMDSGESDATDYDWFTGGVSNTQSIIQAAVIVNNDAVSQTCTVKIKDTSSLTIFSIDYIIAAGDSAFIAELCGQVLDGDDSVPEKVTVDFSVALTGTDTIDCRGSSVIFS
jgi:hypothetical protein